MLQRIQFMYKSKLAETLCSLLESCDSSLQLFWGSIIPQIEMLIFDNETPVTL